MYSAYTDVEHFLCVNRSRCHLLPPYRITELEGMRQMLLPTERQMCSVSDSCLDRACDQHGSPASKVTSPVCHLPDTALGQHRPLHSPSRDLMTVCQPSICSPSFFLWLIQDHGCLAVCFTCLTDSSGSGWPPSSDYVMVSWSSLPCWHVWWHLTPLPGYHDPQCAESLLLFKSSDCVNELFYPLWHTVTSFFYLYTRPTHHPFLRKLMFSIT